VRWRHSIAVAIALLALALAGCTETTRGSVPSPRNQKIADYAVTAYADDAIETLADLVQFATYHPPDLIYTENPEFQAMRSYLENKATELGFDFEDHGPLVVIGLGESIDRLGIVAHGDVQPADPTKWATDPFTLDTTSEPGRLVGRGSEDDKGPLACALYAMKAIQDRRVPLARRIELIVAWTEEWNWDPIRELLATWEPPKINVAFDANYPVVVAEKGWGQIKITFPKVQADGDPAASEAVLESFTGGSFLSQVPEDATAEISSPNADLESALRTAAKEHPAVDFTFSLRGDRLLVTARGLAAHSSVPENGRNALTHLAALLGRLDWPPTPAAQVVNFTNDLVGTGDYAEKFGGLAHSDSFMGRLTLTLATVKVSDSGDDDVVAGLSFRRPLGRTREEIETTIQTAIGQWKESSGTSGLSFETRVFDPYSATNAPQVPILLDVFRHYTGVLDAQPVAMGGGTNASLLPNGVSFGPSMPGEVYTGHTEHEFMTRDQFELNLKMYTAALAQLAGAS